MESAPADIAKLKSINDMTLEHMQWLIHKCMLDWQHKIEPKMEVVINNSDDMLRLLRAFPHAISCHEGWIQIYGHEVIFKK